MMTCKFLRNNLVSDQQSQAMHPSLAVCLQAGYVAPSSSCTDEGDVLVIEADSQPEAVLQAGIGRGTSQIVRGRSRKPFVGEY